jgi:hypothetical protein
MTHGALPILAALFSVLLFGLTLYAGMIRCPRCSKRITAVPDIRDGKPSWGSAPPPRYCRFCGCDLSWATSVSDLFFVAVLFGLTTVLDVIV